MDQYQAQLEEQALTELVDYQTYIKESLCPFDLTPYDVFDTDNDRQISICPKCYFVKEMYE